MPNKTLSEFKGQETGENIGDSKIYASDEEILLFEALQIPFELHHRIERAIRDAEHSAAVVTRQKIVREIELRGQP